MNVSPNQMQDFFKDHYELKVKFTQFIQQGTLEQLQKSGGSFRKQHSIKNQVCVNKINLFSPHVNYMSFMTCTKSC